MFAAIAGLIVLAIYAVLIKPSITNAPSLSQTENSSNSDLKDLNSTDPNSLNSDLQQLNTDSSSL